MNDRLHHRSFPSYRRLHSQPCQNLYFPNIAQIIKKCAADTRAQTSLATASLLCIESSTRYTAFWALELRQTHLQLRHRSTAAMVGYLQSAERLSLSLEYLFANVINSHPCTLSSPLKELAVALASPSSIQRMNRHKWM